MAKHQNTVGTSTYEKIKRDIIYGALAPGVKLKLDTLKHRYAASVSTLRETLNRLASEGFVAAEEQRGFFVTPVSREDMIEITNLRILLECHALSWFPLQSQLLSGATAIGPRGVQVGIGYRWQVRCAATVRASPRGQGA